MQGDEENGVENTVLKLTGCAALRRRLLRELLEHLRVLGVRWQVQQPCASSPQQENTSHVSCRSQHSIPGETQCYELVWSMDQCVHVFFIEQELEWRA